MKCKRERFTVPVSVASYEKMRDEAYQQALKDGVQQGVAIALMALERGYGWRRKRLGWLLDVINEWLEMPEIFGQEVTGEDVIAYLREAYHVDMDALKIAVEVRDRKGVGKAV